MRLLAKIWYVAQILPLHRPHTQQLTTIVSWFLWHGAIFHVPITTLQCPKSEGGWALPNIEMKCRTLLYHWMNILRTQCGSATAELMRRWDISSPVPNPPLPRRVPSKIVHIHNIDMVYVTPCAPEDSPKTFRRKIYGVLYSMDINTRPPNDLRIVNKFPGTDGAKVWGNIHDGGFSDTTKSIWYAVVHDIIPTNSRLAIIQMSSSNACSDVGGLIQSNTR
jgi:hypothetical protein